MFQDSTLFMRNSYLGYMMIHRSVHIGNVTITDSHIAFIRCRPFLKSLKVVTRFWGLAYVNLRYSNLKKYPTVLPSYRSAKRRPCSVVQPTGAFANLLSVTLSLLYFIYSSQLQQYVF